MAYLPCARGILRKSELSENQMPAVEVFTKPPKPGVKLSKKDAGYVDKGPFGCRNCLWFEGGSSPTSDCDPVGGTVSRNGCCDFWNDKDAPKNKGKAGCEYVFVPPYTYTCSICKFFDAATSTCTPVQGLKNPKGSCNKWMPERMTEAPQFNPNILFPGIAQTIREAAQDAATNLAAIRNEVGKVVEANPMNGTGGRVPKTDPDTLATLNSPCSTCGHSYLSHNLDAKKCFFCMPKGSQHTYHEAPDLAPHLIKVPSATGGTEIAKPEAGITGMVPSGRVSEVDAALDRILETYFASSVSSDVESNKSMDGQRKALTLYNAHSTAAHRSSTAAYIGGGNNSAAHQVASEHHKLAGQAAEEAAKKHTHPQTKKDLQTAAKYHNSQAAAHKAAAQTQESGNRQPYSYEMSSGSYNY